MFGFLYSFFFNVLQDFYCFRT